jgi:hypothetical protein
VRADRVEALVPSVWLWRRLFEKESKPQSFVVVQGWQVETIPSPDTNGPGASPHETVRQITDILGTLVHWIPSAAVSNGAVHADRIVVDFPAAAWARGNLWAQVGVPGAGQRATVRVDLAKGTPYELRLASDSLRVESNIRVSLQATAMDVQATGLWRSNHVALHARFGRQSTLPEAASLLAPEVEFPASLLGLKGYRDVRGSVTGKWDGRAFALNATADALPTEEVTNAGPERVQVELHASGNTNFATIENLVLSSPSLKVELSKRQNLYFAGLEKNIPPPVSNCPVTTLARGASTSRTSACKAAWIGPGSRSPMRMPASKMARWRR